MTILFCLLVTGPILWAESASLLSTTRASSDLVHRQLACRYDEIKTNITVDPDGTCGCYTETLMSKENEPYRCNTPVEVGCNIGLANGYVVEDGKYLQKTSPLLNENCSFVKSIFVWNLDSSNSRNGIWIDVTKEATKYISLELGSQIQVKDIDKEAWRGHVLKVNFGCLETCAVKRCRRDCTILKISGYIEYPFSLMALLGPCAGLLFGVSFLTIIMVLGVLLLLLMVLNCCLFWCFCGCGRRCWKINPHYSKLSSSKCRRYSSNYDLKASSKTTLNSLEICESPGMEKKHMKEVIESDGVKPVDKASNEMSNKSGNTYAEKEKSYRKLYKGLDSIANFIYYGEPVQGKRDQEASKPLLSQTQDEDLTSGNEGYFDDKFSSAHSDGLLLGQRPVSDQNPYFSYKDGNQDDVSIRSVRINVKNPSKSSAVYFYKDPNQKNDDQRYISSSQLTLKLDDRRFSADDSRNINDNRNIDGDDSEKRKKSSTASLYLRPSFLRQMSAPIHPPNVDEVRLLMKGNPDEPEDAILTPATWQVINLDESAIVRYNDSEELYAKPISRSEEKDFYRRDKNPTEKFQDVADGDDNQREAEKTLMKLLKKPAVGDGEGHANIRSTNDVTDDINRKIRRINSSSLMKTNVHYDPAHTLATSPKTSLSEAYIPIAPEKMAFEGKKIVMNFNSMEAITNEQSSYNPNKHRYRISFEEDGDYHFVDYAGDVEESDSKAAGRESYYILESEAKSLPNEKVAEFRDNVDAAIIGDEERPRDIEDSSEQLYDNRFSESDKTGDRIDAENTPLRRTSKPNFVIKEYHSSN